MDLYAPVTSLQGIGPTRAKQLKALNIETVYDLLAYFPRAYEDRTKLVTIDQLEPDQPACFEGIVVKGPTTSHIRKGLSLTKLQVADLTGKLNLVYFNQPYVAENLHYGETYIFYGTISGDYGNQMQNPACEPADAPGVTTRRILPIYGLTAGISNKLMVKCVSQALDACLDALPELLPYTVMSRYGLCSQQEAYAAIHQPESWKVLEQARKSAQMSF